MDNIPKGVVSMRLGKIDLLGNSLILFLTPECKHLNIKPNDYVRVITNTSGDIIICKIK